MATPEAHQLSESEEVQLRVFTRWVNWKLEKTGVEVGSLEVGLESGVKLLQLLEVLAPDKKLPKYHKKPSKASHKTQNLSAALSFITQTEKIDLDNIEASDITDQNLPKILSLVRSLILHYHLKEPKEALLEFLNAALPGRDISNFSTNWRDGSNLAALVNYCKPDLVKSATQEQNGTLQNITNVMDLAEKELHVPQLLTHEDLATENPDELCVMIYISCFIGDTLKSKMSDIDTGRASFDTMRSERLGSVASTKSEGSDSPKPTTPLPGDVITGLNLENEKFRVRVPYKLKLHCEDLGEDHPDIKCEPASGSDILLTPAPGANSYWFEILPKETGPHMISVQYKGAHIFGSPFHVYFSPRGDASKCEMINPIIPDCQQRAGNNVVICISTKGAGRGKITAVVKSLSSKKHLPASITHPYKHHYNVEFDPTEGNDYILTIKYDGENIQGSPFHLELGNPTQCCVDGDGVYSAQINKLSKFSISTENAGPGNLGVSVEGEEETLEPTITTIDSNHCEVSYLPTKGGFYKVFVRWSGVNIPGSPFEVACIDPSLVNVVERITESFMGRSVKFTVTSPLETQDEKQVTIVAHSDDHVVPGQVEKVDELTYSCTVNPPAPGTYSVHLCWGGVHINGSPRELKVTPAPTPEDFTVKAAELESGSLGVDVSGPSQAFKYGELSASVINEVTKEKLPVTVTINSQSHCTVEFKPIPSEGIEYTLSIKYEGEGISGSPFALIATDASQCTTEGKGLSFAKTGEWNHFTIHAENERMGELKVHIEGEGEVVEPLISAANEMHYRVDYMPKRRGIYTITVKWGFEHVPNSPFKVYCSDPTQFCIKEHVKYAPTWIPIKFDVETQQTPVEWEKLSVVARSKHKEDIHGEVKQGEGGKYKCFITIPETGKYVIHVRCNGFEISESPFRVRLMPTPVPENVQVYGPGLKDGSVGQEGTFTISVAGAGHGYLSFRVEGPKGAFKIHMKHHPDKKDTILAQYNPLHAGKYTISVLWAGVHIPGSPFSVSILEAGEQDEETT